MHCTASSNPHPLTVSTLFLHLICWKWFERKTHMGSCYCSNALVFGEDGWKWLVVLTAVTESHNCILYNFGEDLFSVVIQIFKMTFQKPSSFCSPYYNFWSLHLLCSRNTRTENCKEQHKIDQHLQELFWGQTFTVPEHRAKRIQNFIFQWYLCIQLL